MNERARRPHPHFEGRPPEGRPPEGRHSEGRPHRHDSHPPLPPGDRHGGRRGFAGGKARRGEVRYVLLDALRNGPKHGYEMIKALEERSSGQYLPSPGTIYPTLQHLEELGLVQSNQSTDRRIYHLTDAGRIELDAHIEEVNAFWARLANPISSAASQAEIGFLQDELGHLAQTVWSGLHNALEQDDHRTIRRVRLAVEQCQNEIRRIITEPDSDE
ncbi:MAG: helix-turn-helix transcriptional regulator [Leptolyngbyaceae cyanobacterium CRU_2_3]|nr:helix-turn-helix transcriptional regulator [Leptolyngbyaceae cyanobacterium CRU_2_3]